MITILPNNQDKPDTFRINYKHYIFEIKLFDGVRVGCQRSKYQVSFEQATGRILVREALIKQIAQYYQEQIEYAINMWEKQTVDGVPYAGLDLSEFLVKILSD